VGAADLGPWDEVRVLRTQCAGERALGERADGEVDLRREEPERAVEARRDAREDDALWPLNPSVPPSHHRDQAALMSSSPSSYSATLHTSPARHTHSKQSLK